MDPRLQSFLDRLPKSATGLAEDVTTAFAISSRFATTKAAEIDTDETLSREGKRLAKQKAMEGGPILHMLQIRDRNKLALMAVRGRRKALVPTEPADTRMIAESQRAEARSVLRSLSPAERAALVMSTDDPLVIDAALFASPFLTGISATVREQLMDKIVRERHGEALAQLDADEEALRTVEAAIEVATGELLRTAEVEIKAAAE